jgi:hypothetical protein
MPKRFTDTEKWKKKFVRRLASGYKLFWLYILDDCNHAGIWEVDFEIARIKIGSDDIKQEQAIKIFGSKIHIFDGGEKWFIPDFIDFQYGKLNDTNRAHKSVVELLSKYSLLKLINKPLLSPLQGAKDKEKDKDKAKDKDSAENNVFETWKRLRAGRKMSTSNNRKDSEPLQAQIDSKQLSMADLEKAMVAMLDDAGWKHKTLQTLAKHLDRFLAAGKGKKADRMWRCPECGDERAGAGTHDTGYCSKHGTLVKMDRIAV